MVSKFKPQINQTYFMDQHSMLQILEGKGGIQVDFQIYHDWQDKIIFLDKGQHIRFLSDSFLIRQINFPEEAVFRNKEIRVLFKHLVSLGYINFNECASCQHYLKETVFSNAVTKIIDISAEQWYWQNPFHANREEYHLIFDVKELVDQQFHQHLSNKDLSKLIKDRGYHAQALYRQKIGISIKRLLGNKRLLEAKKKIAFSDQTIQEIAYDLGYKDPSYFNRVFKQATAKSPQQFRAEMAYEPVDQFIQDLYELLDSHHQEERTTQFYADKLHLSPKTLSRKVKDKLNISLGQLIRQEIINTAKSSLQDGMPVKEVAFQLGFEEANHFSAFFKKYTGTTASQYQQQ